MVKETTTRKPRPPVNADGTPRRKPGKLAKPDDVRTDRLVLRVHPDLMEVLTARAREKGETRSTYVEKLLVGWVRLDPRNRKVDLIGKYVPDAPDPTDFKKRSLLTFLEKFGRFSQASQLLLGAAPPREWVEGDDQGIDYDTEPDVHRRPAEDDAPKSPFPRRR